MWENLNIALKSLNGIILLIIYLRSTTGLTDTIINELSGSFIESGIPILLFLNFAGLTEITREAAALFILVLAVASFIP